MADGGEAAGDVAIGRGGTDHAPAGLQAVHHVGVTVADLDAAIAFWEALLGTGHRDRRLLDGPGVGRLVGYPGVRVEACWLDLPGGVALELLRYHERDEAPYDPGTAHPGNVHVCLQTADLDAVRAHALACGATAVGDAPVDVPAGPRAGTRVAYVRDPDGVTIELFQPPG